MSDLLGGGIVKLSILRSLARRSLYAALLRPLPRPFVHESGNCWSTSLLRLPNKGDCDENRRRSPLLLFEDRQYLGPAHAQRRFVRSIGRGWYSHREDKLYFSTSDNSDPNANGRRYEFSVSRWLYNRQSGVPVNLRPGDASPEAIAADADYAMAGAKYFEAAGRVGVASFEGRTVLELGPGANYAWALLLACRGANPVVADPYLAPWDKEYHGSFYRLLRDRIASDMPDCDVRPLSKLIRAEAFVEGVITRYESPVEELDVPDESVDLVFSNAVAEHLYDFRAAFAQLYRVTKPGGFGFHWVDFRDHRDFERPLEYLLISDAEFWRQFGLRRGEIGNRYRPHEMTEIFAAAGFNVITFETVLEADEEYLAEFTPRLRRASESPYRGLDEEKLRVTSGYYCLQKPG